MDPADKPRDDVVFGMLCYSHAMDPADKPRDDVVFGMFCYSHAMDPADKPRDDRGLWDGLVILTSSSVLMPSG